jgi:hypothetical protein
MNSKTTETHAWFRSRKNGSLPCAWQGWVALVLWLAMGYAGLQLFSGHPWRILTSILCLSAGFNVLLLKRGERPRSPGAEPPPPSEPNPAPPTGLTFRTTLNSIALRRLWILLLFLALGYGQQLQRVHMDLSALTLRPFWIVATFWVFIILSVYNLSARSITFAQDKITEHRNNGIREISLGDLRRARFESNRVLVKPATGKPFALTRMGFPQKDWEAILSEFQRRAQPGAPAGIQGQGTPGVAKAPSVEAGTANCPVALNNAVRRPAISVGLYSSIKSREAALVVVRDSALGFFALAAIQGVVGLFITPLVLIDVAILVVSALALRRWKSRVAAIVLLCICLANVIVTTLNLLGSASSGGRNIILAIIALWLAIRAVWATFLLHARICSTPLSREAADQNGTISWKSG